MSKTESRKKDHVDLCVDGDVAFVAKSTGFERWDFEHNTLPEMNADEVDTSTEFLGRRLSFPLLISGMTGGYDEAEAINAALAEVCEELSIGIGAGSMRQALEDDRFHASWRTIRQHAPSVPVLANIGAAEVARMRDAGDARRLVELLDADALVVHSNPLQEYLQPEGNPQFRGVLTGMELLASKLPVPLIFKEVGAGVARRSALRAYEAGVKWIDVAGAGGTSWAGVEMLRRTGRPEVSPAWRDWGIPTAIALEELRYTRPHDMGIIASGGIGDGLMIAKAIALGAQLAASARPLLQALREGGQEALRNRLLGWKFDLAGAMFLTGSHSLRELASARLIKDDEHDTHD